MQVFRKQLLACAALAAMGTFSVFAQQAQPAQRMRGQHGVAKMAAELNLTADQQAQTKAIFRESRQSAMPVRQQLRQTRKDLQAAIQSGNTEQIQQLATTEGSQVGQLTAIRATAFSKVYKILTPEQQQKFLSIRQEMRAAHRAKS